MTHAGLAAALLLALAGCARPDRDAAHGLAQAHYRVPRLGLDIAILRAGTPGGRRVVFVHGTPGDATAWADMLRHAPAGFEFIAVDRPGFGQTRPGAALPSLARQAEALAPLLTADGRTILVGHSYGGPVIAETAADYPGRVAGLVIAAGALDPGAERTNPIQYVGEWWGVRSLIPRSLRNANRELMPLKGELERLAPRLDRIRTPIVIIHGTRDTHVPIGNVAYMQAHLVHARPMRTIILPGENHFLPWTRRDLIARAVVALARAT